MVGSPRGVVGAAVVMVAAVIVVGTAPVARGQVRSPGGVTVHDEENCRGQGNSAQVTNPFSVAITGLTPGSTTSQAFVTDMDAQPTIQYGPFTLPSVDANGTLCMNILNAPPGRWKIDVVEEGAGFTDSKVVTVNGDSTTTTTIPETTTTTTGGTTTTVDGSTTTTEPTTSTTGGTPQVLPWVLLPWNFGPFVPVPVPVQPTSTTTSTTSFTTASSTTAAFATDPTAELPNTGGPELGLLAGVAALLTVAGLLLGAGRRLDGQRS